MGTPAVREFQPNSSSFGCYAPFEEGIAGRTLCVDEVLVFLFFVSANNPKPQATKAK